MHNTSHDFSLLKFIPFLNEIPAHVATTLIVMGLIIFCSFIAKKKLEALLQTSKADSEEVLVPGLKLTYLNFFEIIAENIYQLTVSVIGEKNAARFFPVIGTLFLFIFSANIIGLIPGLPPSTENFNTTLGLGLFVFFYYNYAGFKESGLKYIKHFFGPVIWLAPLMLVIEVVSHLFRPFSLALRLRGNIMGDHIILGVFSDLVPIVLPTIFYGLGVFVAFIQAFVFCLMTMVYILLSTSHEH